MRKIFIILLLFSFTVPVFSQNKDEELAAQYYANGELEKAADMYEKLLKKNPSSAYIYTNYLNCLVGLNRFDDAARMVKGQVRRYPENFIYPVDLAYVYEKEGETEKANKQLKGLLKEVKSEDQASNLAQALKRRDKYEEAAEVYLAGRKLAGHEFAFSHELATVYSRLGQVALMVKETLRILEYQPEQQTDIQDLLQSTLDTDKDWDILKKELNVRIQHSPENIQFLELLMWTMVQRKEFNAAFIQFKALDKRLKENGRRVMDLGSLALDNQDYDVAAKCYEYVVSLGLESPEFHKARFGLLDVRYKKITVSGQYDSLDLVKTERDYLSFIENNRSFYQIEKPMRQLAELYNYYLHQSEKAMALLKEIIAMPRLSPQFKADCKLELGDAYLLADDIWEAELLYSQVDKDFKEDAFGQEAKFRMAKLFFYKGEFERAQAYLDVLKTATTQLISNDAIELSMLIQDNTGTDSTEQALNMYAHASLLIYRNQVESGLMQLKLIESLYPQHPLADDILYLKGEAAIKRNNPLLAAGYYEEIITKYSFDILADNALFKLAVIYDRRLNDPQKAKDYYEKLMLDYPGSLFVVEARKRYRELRGDKSDTPDKPQLFFNGFTN